MNADGNSSTGVRSVPLVHWFLILVLGLIVYSNTFTAPFQFDDKSSIVENPLIKDPKLLVRPSDYCSGAAAQTEKGLLCHLFKARYVGYLSFAADYAVHGLNVAGYHAVNVLIHVINALLVYAVVLLLERTPFLRRKADITARAGSLPALFTALLFACHPVQTQAVTYIVQRFASLATLFYLVSLAAYIRWRGHEAGDGQRKPKDRGRTTEDKSKTVNLKPALWYAASLVFTVLAMKTKETAFTLPLVIALVEGLFFNATLRRRALFLAPFFLTMLIIPVDLLDSGRPLGDALGSLSESTRLLTPMSRGEYLVTEFRVIVTYLRLIMFPVNQNLDYDYQTYHSFFAPPVFFSFLLLLGMIGLGAYWVRRSRRGPRALRLAAFGIFWFFITLSVESSIVPIVDVIFEHRLYLPSVGAFIAITTGSFGAAAALKERRRIARSMTVAALTIGVIAFAGSAFARNKVWHDEITLWEDVVRKSPGKARGYTNLGIAYGVAHYENDEAKLAHAIDLFTTAISLEPSLAQAYCGRGLIYHKLGRDDRAIEDYTKAAALNPALSTAYNERGQVYTAMGNDERALDDFARAIGLDPDLASAFNNRGLVYLRRGQYDFALDDFRRAVEKGPDRAEHYSNLGAVYHEKRLLDQAIGEYTRALSLDPKLPDAYYNRGLAYAEKKQYYDAIHDFTVTLGLRPLQGRAYLQRGVSRAALGNVADALADLQTACTLGSEKGCEIGGKLKNGDISVVHKE